VSQETETIITVALIGFAVVAWLWPLMMGIYLEVEEQKKRNEPPQYDERQRLARMQAGNHALFVLVGFLNLWAVIDQLEWFPWTASILDMVLCAMLLAWCVWMSECILCDAFVTWKNKNLGPSGSAFFYVTVMINWTYNFWTTGIIDSAAPFVFACGNMLALCIVILYKRRKDKKPDVGDAEV